MRELILTRRNEMIDPVLRVWGWEIPVYLFLGGWVAGMMIITGYYLLKGENRRPNCVCAVLPVLGIAVLSLGMLALFLDLEHKLYVWRLYTTFQVGSPMSWGAWILVLVYPALAAAAFVRPPAPLSVFWDWPERLHAWVGQRRAVVRAVGAVNVALGAMLGIYTGILLSALGARPLWNSAMLGILFLLSGMSASAAFVHLIARDAGERRRLMQADTAFLGLELVAVALFLIGLATATRAHADAARLLLGGPYTAVFWVGAVGLGIVLPFIVQLLAASHRIAHTLIAPLLVMAGGLVLRFVIVYAGQYSHWTRG
ncbi:MAG: NrfD/PsrC family molybdoenzyme membrane anchor subunit [Vicinamibacterales bacterium]